MRCANCFAKGHACRCCCVLGEGCRQRTKREDLPAKSSSFPAYSAASYVRRLCWKLVFLIRCVQRVPASRAAATSCCFFSRPPHHTAWRTETSCSPVRVFSCGGSGLLWLLCAADDSVGFDLIIIGCCNDGERSSPRRVSCPRLVGCWTPADDRAVAAGRSATIAGRHPSSCCSSRSPRRFTKKIFTPPLLRITHVFLDLPLAPPRFCLKETLA